MKSWVQTLCLLLLIQSPIISWSQFSNGNFINVITNRPVIFTFNSIDDLLQKNVVQDAFEIKVLSPENDFTVMANFVANTPDATAFFEGKLALKLNNRNNGHSINWVGMSEIPISVSPTPVLMYKHYNSSKKDEFEKASFFYDLILKPSSTIVKPGIYNFSIVFTISEP
jgi:hypothetical protein